MVSAVRCSRRCRAVRGFTLLELLVVVAIIGLLAAYVGPRYFAQIGKSEITATKAQIEAFSKALDTYRLDTGHFPTTEQGLGALLSRPPGESRWNGPYLQKAIPLDPWGKPYSYRTPAENKDYEIRSHGKDGDITN
jgi:general secretion pathway protein G